MSTLTCEVGENAPPVCLVIENPNRLVTLLDMLQISAYNFISIGSGIDNLNLKLATCNPSHPVAGPALTKYLELLDFIENNCELMDLGHTRSTVRSIRKEQESRELSNGTIWQALKEINRSFVLELESEKFLHVASRDAEFLCKREAFGSKVAAHFGSCGNDIWVAGNCFALELYDSCVFNLMRGLERGLAAMALKFGVLFEHRNWHNIIEEVESRIRKIDATWGPDWKDQHKKYSEAATQFMFIKDAWRNHVVHGRDTYDRDRTKKIFEATGELMLRISEIGLKEMT